MLKEMIDRIMDFSQPVGTVLGDGRIFMNSQAKQIMPPIPATIPIHSLTGLMDLLKAGPDAGIKEPVFIHIVDHATVNIVASEMDLEMRRRVYAQAKFTNTGFRYDTFMPVEQFLIAVRAFFIQDTTTDYIFSIAGNVSSDAKLRSVDNGISQSITVKKGIAKVQDVVVQDILGLVPFRSFSEIEQVPSEFVFRMRQSDDGPPTAAIFTAGDESWKLEAILRIKTWFHFQDSGSTQLVIG